MMRPALFVALLLACGITGYELAHAQGYATVPPAPAVTSIQPAANSNGTITATIGMQDGSSLSGTSTTPVTVNPVTTQSYCPSSTNPFTNTITNGATIQIPGSCTYAVLAGSGILTTATIKLPASPLDAQVVRLVLPSGLTITALTIQSATGAAVSCSTCTTVLFGASPVFQYQNGAWLQVSKG